MAAPSEPLPPENGRLSPPLPGGQVIKRPSPWRDMAHPNHSTPFAPWPVWQQTEPKLGIWHLELGRGRAF